MSIKAITAIPYQPAARIDRTAAGFYVLIDENDDEVAALVRPEFARWCMNNFNTYAPDQDPAWVLRAQMELYEAGFKLDSTATLNPIMYRWVNAHPTMNRPNLCDWQPTIALATTYAWAAMKENA